MSLNEKKLIHINLTKIIGCIFDKLIHANPNNYSQAQKIFDLS